MRKAQKAQILEMLKTLREAHQIINSCLDRKELGKACALLADCQQSAIRVGELIEENEGEHCPAIWALEDYCETVYQVGESGSRQSYKRLDTALRHAETSIRNDVLVRLECAFFPYKSSMWDSMESVWRAAIADPDCDAYVVPVPYYDINMDGSLGQMRYEGGLYPAYVPVVDWRTYSLEARRPDVVYIHNPYDEQNSVTQVHSMYFSSNLKNYTELLCYIPYFVASEGINPHFAYLPSVLNADYTVVESEKIRQQYFSVWETLVRNGRAKVEDFAIIKQRILPLGSPKFDAVRNTVNVSVPENWRRQIQKNGGTCKKVILYNTSIADMLAGTVDAAGEISDRYLKKLESVLDYFKHRPDIVLLWRPHPLLAQTFASMRPQLLSRYRKIVEDYQNENYGIYDESSDLHRAMEISDAYYGDSSSVMYLWEKTGKPLLLSALEITSYQRRLVVRNLYFDKECFWCTADDFNGLFRIERNTVHYVGQFPGEKREDSHLFGEITECDEKLYFAPWSARHIGVYDKKTGELSSIPIPLTEEERNLPFKYYPALTHKKSVYLIGNQINAILRFDMQTESFTLLNGWKHHMEANKVEGAETFFSNACRNDSKVYVFSKYANSMLCFDMSDHHWRLIPFSGRNRKYCRGVCVKDDVWFCSSVEASVGVYESASGKIIHLDAPELFAGGFGSIQTFQDSVFCFSRQHSTILKINTKTYQMQLCPSMECCDYSVVNGTYCYAVSPLTGSFQQINLETMECQTEELRLSWSELPELDIQAMLTEPKSGTVFARENAFVNLDMLAAGTEVISPKHKKKQSNCGETIYQYMKKVII